MTPIPSEHNPLAPLYALLFPAPAQKPRCTDGTSKGCPNELREEQPTGAGEFTTEPNNNKPNETKPQ